MRMAHGMKLVCAGLLGVGLVVGCGGDEPSREPAEKKTPETAVSPMGDLLKIPLTSADVDKLLKIWPEVNRAGGIAELKRAGAQPTGPAPTDFEVAVAAKKAITDGGMTVHEFGQKAVVATAAAHFIMEGHDPEAIRKAIAEAEKQAAVTAHAGNPQLAATFRVSIQSLKQTLKIAESIPTETREAVKPHAAEILELSRGVE